MKKDLVSVENLSKEDILYILDMARRMEKGFDDVSSSRPLAGKIMATLFFEPSTRTRLSFESAMHRLGGSVIGFSSKEGTSVKKGETLADTIRVIDGYSDVIVIRHPYEGAATLASELASHPVLNAGDGAGRHPTQTLLDLYTIWKEFGRLDKKVALVGDLKYGRTVHSLALALSRFGAEFYFVSPESLRMPDHILRDVGERTSFKEFSGIEGVIKDVDVLYMTRIQKERFPDPSEYAKVSGAYKVDKGLVSKMAKNAIIMHPLPRVNEIGPEVDSLPQARYFQQSWNGVYTRMAILLWCLGIDNIS